MVEAALRSVVREAIARAAQEGLPGEHHFYITFRTAHPGVDIAEYLKERYPGEMTIVLQHQFYGLDVSDERFEVTLSFNNIPERLSIPLDAITIFADPSVNFALQFQPSEGDAGTAADESEETGTVAPEPASEGDQKSGEVVSLDQFRRK